MDVRKKEVIWNQVKKCQVLMRPEPTLREVLESVLDKDRAQFVQEIQFKALTRVVLELMDAHEEFDKMLSRFEV